MGMEFKTFKFGVNVRHSVASVGSVFFQWGTLIHKLMYAC